MRITTIGVIVSVLCTPFAALADELFDQFERSCIGTLPDFAEVAASLKDSNYKKKNGRMWIRESDGAGIQVNEATDRFMCMLALTGDHVKRFEIALKSRLEEGELGPYEIKLFEGRNLYLVQTPNGRTILEVIPPFGATTFLAAHARKER